jgi:pimeloyl-ACP methyl ester carboxylesterase
LTWSQEKSRGPIEQALDELQLVLEAIPRGEKKVLLGHSRGGLVARKYLQEHRAHWDRIAGVVLMGVPNHGSQIAKSGELLDKARLFFLTREGNQPIFRGLPRKKTGLLSLLIRAFAVYAGQGGIKELVPRSAFMRRLTLEEGEERYNKIPYFNLIGNRTDFIRIYLRLSPAAKAILIFSLLDDLEKILPRSFLPPEIQQGKGDGQVSVKSAILDWAEKNQILPINHAQFLVATEVQSRVQLFLEAI